MDDLSYLILKGVQTRVVEYKILFLFQKLYTKILLDHKLHLKAWKLLKEMVRSEFDDIENISW